MARIETRDWPHGVLNTPFINLEESKNIEWKHTRKFFHDHLGKPLQRFEETLFNEFIEECIHNMSDSDIAPEEKSNDIFDGLQYVYLYNVLFMDKHDDIAEIPKVEHIAKKEMMSCYRAMLRDVAKYYKDKKVASVRGMVNHPVRGQRLRDHPLFDPNVMTSVLNMSGQKTTSRHVVQRR